jgi:glutathione S-transferase
MKLYELSPGARSARCRWLLLEMGVNFDSVPARDILGTVEFAKVNPFHTIPALEENGRTLFESAAICNYLADKFPEKNLIPKTGTWDRALHDQWSYFALTEMEPYLWLNTKHTRMYPESERVPQVIEPNNKEFLKAARVLDNYLAGRLFMVGETFSVTDIIVGYTLHWARRLGLLAEFAPSLAYLDRLFQRPHCPLGK